MPQPVAAVAVAFAVAAEYFQRPVSDVVARMYAADVADLPTAAVIRAMTELRREPKRRTLPLPSEVRAQVMRSQPGAGPAVAEQIAARISGAISRYGYTGATRARAYMGEVGWEACEELGGYIALCQRLKADEMGTFFAQSREICRAILDRGPKQAEQRTALPDGQQKRFGSLVDQVLGGVGAPTHGHGIPAKRLAAGPR